MRAAFHGERLVGWYFFFRFSNVQMSSFPHFFNMLHPLKRLKMEHLESFSGLRDTGVSFFSDRCSSPDDVIESAKTPLLQGIYTTLHGRHPAPCECWDKLPLNRCRISSINSSSCGSLQWWLVRIILLEAPFAPIDAWRISHNFKSSFIYRNPCNYRVSFVHEKLFLSDNFHIVLWYNLSYQLHQLHKPRVTRKLYYLCSNSSLLVTEL